MSPFPIDNTTLCFLHTYALYNTVDEWTRIHLSARKQLASQSQCSWTLPTGEKYIFVYVRAKNPHSKRGRGISFRFAGQIYPRMYVCMYHQAQSWKKTISGFAQQLRLRAKLLKQKRYPYGVECR